MLTASSVYAVRNHDNSQAPGPGPWIKNDTSPRQKPSPITAFALLPSPGHISLYLGHCKSKDMCSLVTVWLDRPSSDDPSMEEG